MAEFVKEPLTITNRYGNLKYTSGGDTFDKEEVCEIKCRNSYKEDITLLRIISSSNDVALHVYDSVIEAETCSAVVEALKPKSNDLKRPTTLWDVLTSESSSLDTIFTMDSDQNKYVFTLKFKQFIREWIELIVTTRKKYGRVICCNSSKSILVNKHGDWKLFILGNKARTKVIRENVLDGVHATITDILDIGKRRLGNDAFAQEINYLLSPLNSNIHIGRHPALLPPGGKRDLLFSACDAIDDNPTFLTFPISQTFSTPWSFKWFHITDRYPLLKKVTRYNSQNPSIDLSDLEMNDSRLGLVRGMKNLFKHINDYVTDFGVGSGNLTPLSAHHEYYQTSHIEHIVDILFPGLASSLHEDIPYSNPNMSYFFCKNDELEPEP